MFEIIPVPAFTDNYIWMLVDRQKQQCLCVDPGDAQAVEHFLAQQNLSLKAILITHHHYDHIDGVTSLVKKHHCSVYGPGSIPQVDHPLKEGDEVSLLDHSFKIHATPGHTLDHLSYYSEPYLFCGDTLFSLGCGRMFEGTPEMMWNSLKKLRQLPDHTEVFCTHEYTLSNLKFALSLTPDNAELQRYQLECEAMRAKNKPTLPASLSIERQINPFLRCDNSELQALVQAISKDKINTPAQCFATIRKLKDQF